MAWQCKIPVLKHIRHNGYNEYYILSGWLWLDIIIRIYNFPQVELLMYTCVSRRYNHMIKGAWMNEMCVRNGCHD